MTKETDKKQNPKRKWLIALIVVASLAAVILVLSFFTPTRETMKANISEALTEKPQYSEVYYNYGFLKILKGNDEASRKMVAETFIGICGQVVPANDGFAGFVAKMLSWLPVLLEGTKITVLLTLVSVCAGIVMSVFLALGKMSKHKVLSKFCSAYIFFFRGTPLLMQLYFIYYGLPLISQALTIENRFLAAFIAFSLNSAAYCAEIVRAAIQSIDKGQMEAGRALGMGYGQTMRHIIIPQSIRRLIPPVANEFIMVLKDASLVSVIALTDLTFLTRKLATSNATPLVYLPAMGIYLVITWLFTLLFNYLEKKYSVYE